MFQLKLPLHTPPINNIPLFSEQNDPCRDKLCGFGARCVVALDGHNASCVCPDECPNSFEHDENTQTVCGSNGVDYTSQCEINKAACTSNKNITVAFKGKCGKFLIFKQHIA